MPTERQAPDPKRPMRTATVRVRDRYTRAVIHEIGVTAAFAQGSNYGRFLRGLLRKVDCERFFVDDSDVAELFREPEGAADGEGT
jgi:hypothetical protein